MAISAESSDDGKDLSASCDLDGGMSNTRDVKFRVDAFSNYFKNIFYYYKKLN